MKLKTFFFHWKLKYFGDKKFERDGGGIVPCIKCNHPFKSYMHYGDIGYIYDSICENCEKQKE